MHIGVHGVGKGFHEGANVARPESPGDRAPTRGARPRAPCWRAGCGSFRSAIGPGRSSRWSGFPVRSERLAASCAPQTRRQARRRALATARQSRAQPSCPASPADTRNVPWISFRREKKCRRGGFVAAGAFVALLRAVSRRVFRPAGGRPASAVEDGKSPPVSDARRRKERPPRRQGRGWLIFSNIPRRARCLVSAPAGSALVRER